MSALDDLKAAVAAEETIVDSAVALIGGLAEKIREKIDDPDGLEDLAQQLEAQDATLAAAVAANTPSASSELHDDGNADETASAPADASAAAGTAASAPAADADVGTPPAGSTSAS